MEFILIRHGQSQSNAGLTTHLDSDLTPLGQAQALATAQRLQSEGVDGHEGYQAFASPFRRTLETLAPLHALTDVPCEVLAEICEYFSVNNAAYLTFHGQSPAEIARDYPYVQVGTTFPCEVNWWPKAQEDAFAIYARVSSARDTLLSLYGATPVQVIIFSHADTIGRMTEALLRVPPRVEGPPWSDNCGISRLRVADPGRAAEVAYLNDTAHLEKLGLRSPV